MKRLASLFLASTLAVATASAVTPQEIVDRSAEILRGFRTMPEKAIPRRVLNDARGLAIMSVLKVGVGISGQGGQGVVVARTGHGWSGPSFIGTGGAGYGLQIGGEITEFVFVLNTDAAVRSFSREGNITIGGDASAAAGPVGRDVQAGVTPSAAIYTYSRSQGLFAGISLQGAVIATQKTANARYYRHAVSARQILSGRASPPAGASVLLRALGR